MDLVKKTLFGLSWVLLFNLIAKGMRFIITIVLARMLEPSDFGIVGIALVVLNSIAMFQGLGISSALVYEKEDIDKKANTAFFIIVFTGFICFLVSFIGAPFIADFFNSIESGPIIRVLSLTILIASFGSVNIVLLDKELEFKKQLMPEIMSMLTYGVTAISLAFLDYGYWSLVYGKVLSITVWLIMFMRISPWRPHLEFDFTIARKLLKYGRHVFGGGLIAFLLFSVDNGFIGKYLGTTALGYYVIAYNLSHLFALNISRLVNRVIFPTYTKLQDNPKSLTRIYLKTVRYISFIAMPVCFGLYAIAPDIISVLYGEKWLPAVIPLQILCISGLFKSIRSTTGILLAAIGKPDISEKIAIYQLGLVALIIYPLSMHYGISGTAVAMTIPTILFTVIGYFVVRKIMDVSVTSIFEAMLYPFLSSVLMLAMIWLVYPHMPSISIIRLIILVLLGILSYMSFIYIINRKILLGIYELYEKARN